MISKIVSLSPHLCSAFRFSLFLIGCSLGDGSLAKKAESTFSIKDDHGVLIAVYDKLDSAVDAHRNGTPVSVWRSQHSDIKELRRVALMLDPLNCTPRVVDQIRVGGPDDRIRYSVDEHPLHTDGNFEPVPPHTVLLQVISTDRGGEGASLFRRVQAVIAEAADSGWVDILREVPVIFQSRVDKQLRFSGPLFFRATKRKEALRFGSDRDVMMSVDPSVTSRRRGEQALQWIVDEIASMRHTIDFTPQSGDIMMIDNEAVLHGRRALSSQSNNPRLLNRIHL